MDSRKHPPPPQNIFGTHFLDIPEEALAEEDEENANKQHGSDNNNNNYNKQQQEKVLERRAKNNNIREGKRPNMRTGFSRQVSLETGFSVLNADSRKDGRRFLTRSGKSLGAYGTRERTASAAVEGRRGDFNMFRTKSTLSRQSSALHRKLETGIGMDSSQKNDIPGGGGGGGGGGGVEESMKRSVPAGRYFAALRGPELDEVKDSEDILLPKDEIWPFLLRFPIGCYGICLGLSSQAILWRALSTSASTKFLHIPPMINFVIWVLAVSVLVAISVTYALKCALYFEAVRREYFHPVRVNFFFAPWVVCMFLAIGIPTSIAPENIHPAVWCVFMTPILFLELKIYGQWLSGGKRRLCQVANPSSHLSVIGNFVGAILAAKVGWKEPGKFLWAVGFAHYLVVFVTLYQRLPTSEALPKELHPVYSMFIATPAAASLAWGTLYGEFDGLSRTCYFIALFLFLSLVVRINFFRGFRFSVAWWSYTFPMTTISIATIKYAEDVPSVMTKVLALGLSFMSSTMVSILFVSTFLHAFVWQTLFPNDLAIAITKRRQGKEKKSLKKVYDIKRWTKQSPLSFTSSTRKQNPDKDSDGEN